MVKHKKTFVWGCHKRETYVIILFVLFCDKMTGKVLKSQGDIQILHLMAFKGEKKMKGNNSRGRKKNCKMQSMGIFLASILLATTGGTQYAYAENGKFQSEATAQTSESGDEAAEEKKIIYLNGKTGSDKNTGKSEKQAVLTFKKAAGLAGDYGIIRICGTVTVSNEATWTLPDGVCIRRADGFEGALVKVTGSLTLDNVRIYTEDITGDGTVEGAVEREKVYVPSSITIETPVELGEISLERCEGDGIFAWADEEFLPTEYETICKVIFYPDDIKKIDYTQEKGWDEEKETVVRKVTIRVDSLKPEEEEDTDRDSHVSQPTATPETTPEVTPESTPEAAPTVTPVATPEVTPTVTPVTTPEATPESTPGITPESTPENTPEVLPSVTPEEGEKADTPEDSGTNPDKEPSVTPVPDDSPEEERPEGMTAEEWAAIQNVQSMIDYLPAPVDAAEIVEAIVDTTKAYEALSEEQRAYLTDMAAEKLAQAQAEAAVWNRSSNGVTIEGDFPWYVRFIAELKTEETNNTRAVNELVFPYDFVLWDMMHDCIYDMNGKSAMVTMPAPDEGRYDKIVMVHYLENGAVEYITPIYNEDNTMTVATASFAEPVAVAFTARIAGSNSLVGNTDKVYEPSAGSGSQASSNNNTGSSNKPSTGTGSSQTSGTTGSGKGNSSSANLSNKGSANTGTSKKQTLTNSTGNAKRGTSQTAKNPNTGDEQHPVLYAGLAGAALAVMGYGMIIRKRRRSSRAKEQ